MEKLNNLYQKRKVFLEYNRPVPEELTEQIQIAESEIISTASETFFGYLPVNIDMPKGCSIAFGVEYKDGKLIKTAQAFNASLDDKFDTVSSFVEDEPVIEEPEPSRTRSHGFAVKFGDGKIIKHTFAQQTMIEALRYMGLERASKFTDVTFMGYPLIGKKRRPGERWQKNIDGWWVYINLSNERKIVCLKEIAKMLNIPLEIISEEEYVRLNIVQPKEKNKRRMFSLNGSTPMMKNQSVWETVKRYLEEFPDATFDDIVDMFPANLQGSYGVVRTVEDVDDRLRRNKTEDLRWFLGDSHILTAGDGVKFRVCNEWGDNYEAFQNHVSRELGWTLDEEK